MIIDFHPEAEIEFLESIEEYEEKSTGLGDQFYSEVQTALVMLRSFPEIGSPYEKSDRKIFLNRFPYALVYNYQKTEDYIEIYAVMHQSQKPGYWTYRR